MIRLTKYLIGILLLSLFSGCSVKSKIRKADKKYEIGEYYNAANIYSKAYPKVKLKDRQLKAYTAFKLGDCYRLTNLDEKAERAFANAVKFNYKDSIVFLYYADALRKNQKMKYAITLYDSYLATHPNDQRAINGKQSAEEAAEWEKNPTRYIVKKEEFFSSKKAEFSPAFPGGDGEIVYFNSSRENKEIGGGNSKITGLRNNGRQDDVLHPLRRTKRREPRRTDLLRDPLRRQMGQGERGETIPG